MDMYTFRPFVEADFPKMHQAFLSAFADYTLPFNLSYQQFIEKFVHKLNINLPLSVGAYKDDELVAFMFTGVGIYRNKKTAYNGGTGVVPSHRRKALTIKMYDYLWPIFKKGGIEQAVLEVLTTNERAIKSYQTCGFTLHTRYHCFQLKAENLIKDKAPASIAITKKEKANWPLYATFLDCNPSYLDSIPILTHNIANEHIAEAKEGDTTVGYIIFQSSAARISQLAIAKAYRNKGIGTKLLHYALSHISSKTITLINIDHDEKEVIQVLKQWGFENTADQYEMIQLL